jgi:hypothetical protein
MGMSNSIIPVVKSRTVGPFAALNFFSNPIFSFFLFSSRAQNLPQQSRRQPPPCSSSPPFLRGIIRLTP